jgi:hypothetical protein
MLTDTELRPSREGGGRSNPTDRRWARKEAGISARDGDNWECNRRAVCIVPRLRCQRSARLEGRCSRRRLGHLWCMLRVRRSCRLRCTSQASRSREPRCMRLCRTLAADWVHIRYPSKGGQRSSGTSRFRDGMRCWNSLRQRCSGAGRSIGSHRLVLGRRQSPADRGICRTRSRSA